MAKRVYKRPDLFKVPGVVDIYSVSGHLSRNFSDYVEHWKHNGYWFFDSPEIVKAVAKMESAQLEGTSLFYYQAYEMEYDGERWKPWSPESFLTKIVPPTTKRLEGFDVVTFYAHSMPECSPLSCNSMAKDVHVNEHCLFKSFDEAQRNLSNGAFKKAGPGPYRIFSVYSVDWI